MAWIEMKSSCFDVRRREHGLNWTGLWPSRFVLTKNSKPTQICTVYPLPVAYKTGTAQKELRVDQQTVLSILDPARMWLLHKDKYFDGMISPADACVMRIARLELAPGAIEMRQDSGGSSIYIPFVCFFCIRHITWDWMFSRCAPDVTLLAQWATVRIIINCSPNNYLGS